MWLDEHSVGVLSRSKQVVAFLTPLLPVAHGIGVFCSYINRKLFMSIFLKCDCIAGGYNCPQMSKWKDFQKKVS